MSFASLSISPGARISFGTAWRVEMGTRKTTTRLDLDFSDMSLIVFANIAWRHAGAKFGNKNKGVWK
jgi:hypothetical protein